VPARCLPPASPLPPHTCTTTHATPAAGVLPALVLRQLWCWRLPLDFPPMALAPAAAVQVLVLLLVNARFDAASVAINSLNAETQSW